MLCFFPEQLCHDPPSVEHGTFHSVTAPYGCGSVVMYSCDEGYALAGNKSLVCSDTRQWKGAIPTCEWKGMLLFLLLHFFLNKIHVDLTHLLKLQLFQSSCAIRCEIKYEIRVSCIFFLDV